MSPEPMSSRMSRAALPIALVLTAAACTSVTSIHPTISPNDAVAVPQLLGDWVQVDQDEPGPRIHVRRGPDSTTFVAEVADPVRVKSLSFGRATLSLHAVPLAEGFLVEATPLGTEVGENAPKRNYGDPLVDSLQHRYGRLIQRMYIVVVVKFVGDDLQVSGLSTSKLKEVVEAGGCPEPVRLIEQDGDLILSGDTGQLRRTTDCLLALPDALSQPPTILRRPPRLRPRSPR